MKYMMVRTYEERPDGVVTETWVFTEIAGTEDQDGIEISSVGEEALLKLEEVDAQLLELAFLVD